MHSTAMPAKRDSFRDVPGYEGLYAVTRDGQVWAFEKRRLRVYAARWMKQHQDDDGYMLVTLCRDGGRRTFRTHQLVALAWIGPQPTSGHEVNHDNGSKNDNDVGNLEWSTRQENVQHAWRTGLKSVTEANRAASRLTIKKAQAAARTLTQEQAEAIRSLVAGGMKKARAGRMFGLTYWSVRDIVAGKTYRGEA